MDDFVLILSGFILLFILFTTAAAYGLTKFLHKNNKDHTNKFKSGNVHAAMSTSISYNYNNTPSRGLMVTPYRIIDGNCNRGIDLGGGRRSRTITYSNYDYNYGLPAGPAVALPTGQFIGLPWRS